MSSKVFIAKVRAFFEHAFYVHDKLNGGFYICLETVYMNDNQKLLYFAVY
jgi:transcriptional regulator CtsR